MLAYPDRFLWHTPAWLGQRLVQLAIVRCLDEQALPRASQLTLPAMLPAAPPQISATNGRPVCGGIPITRTSAARPTRRRRGG